MNLFNIYGDLFPVFSDFRDLERDDVGYEFSKLLFVMLKQEVHRGKGDTLTMQAETDGFNLVRNDRGKEHRAFSNLVFQRDTLTSEGVHSGSEGLSPDFKVNFGFCPINLCLLSIQIFVYRINELFCLGMCGTIIFKFKLSMNKLAKLKSF